MIIKGEIASVFRVIQDNICKGLEGVDGKAKFIEDKWNRSGGGGGRTRVIQHGDVFEKGGVNFSEVFGKAPGFMLQENGDNYNTFYATGVSIVIHPISPMIPIIHLNIRYLELDDKKRWFGGGIDLTPVYFKEDDVRFFHSHLKTVCDRFHSSFYPDFKNRADEYFFIRHRNETRGAGGIFYDHLEATQENSMEKILEFTKAIGDSFIPVYTELVRRNRNKNFGEKEKQWQLIRRGRYAEFNLVYDRGTRFGLETDGRTESILMSLPPVAAWEYDHQPDGEELRTQQFLRKGINWV